MRIGFVDCATNIIDAYDAFTKLSDETVAGARFDRITAPDLLKIPLCAKKMLTAGSDIIVVFLTLTGNDIDPMSLVHEKIIDLEIVTEKFVLFCIVSDDEYSDNAGLESLSTERLRTALSLASQLELSPAQVSSAIGDTKVAAELSALAGFASSIKDEPLSADPSDGTTTAQDSDGSGKSLF